MKSSLILKLVSISVVLLLTQACGHPIEIEGQGDVTSANGARNCSRQDKPENTVCNNVVGIDLGRWPELVAVDYAETYTPAPRSGWVFSHWVRCPATAVAPDYACSFQIPKDVVEDYWGKTMPSLKAVFCPENDPDCDGLFGDDDPCPANPTNPCALITGPDIVERIGRQWAQPDLFKLTSEKAGASWKQMNAACPKGKCKVGAVLNDKDLTGWTWAGFGDVALLYNSFGGSLPTDALGGGPVEGSGWVHLVYAAGFRPTLTDDITRTIYVMLARDAAGIAAGIPVATYGGSQEHYDLEGFWDWAGTYAGVLDPDRSYSGAGFLLYRPIP